MPRKSLTACPAGIEKARIALTGKGWSYEKLAEAIGVQTRQPVGNFFNGKGVASENFVAICRVLELNWQEITGQVKPTAPGDSLEKTSTGIDIDELVQQVREKIKPYIQACCGEMRVLDMSQPIGLNDIYTDVNILEKITGRRRLEIEDLQTELLQNSDVEELSRFGLCVTQKRVAGLEAVQQHSKLMVLGKPGAGKTTFLKYLAIQCIQGQFQGDHFPVFITLKDFAEADKKPDISEYIALQLSKYQVRDGSTKAEQLLNYGKVLVLLDGLDEVREEDTKRVLNQVQDFSYQFHANQFVITCRIAAKEYTFQGFTEVEVADFNSKQIATFAQNWFRLSDQVKGERFMQKLKANRPIEELATNPLLLTLLCLVFGEAGNFPTNRSELYKEGIDVLLKKWDAKRNIERDEVYKDLSLQRKEDLLSQIALTTFEQKDYFFKQKTVETYIADFIFNLPNARTQPKELELDSEAVLKSIEAQHGLLVARAKGIYSFSHLTFHEYFTARKIALSRNPQESFLKLATNITQKRWREILFLTLGILPDADDLLQLIKQQIDKLVVIDDKLLQFITWAEEKSCSVKVRYKTAAVRAFYAYLALDLDRDLARDLARDFARDLAQDLAQDLSLNLALARDLPLVLARDLPLVFTLDLALALVLDLARDLPLDLLDLARDLPLDLALARDFARDHNPKLERSLQQLLDQLPDSRADEKKAFKRWWEENGRAWIEQLRALMIKHCNIGHDWQFSKKQKELLQQYYDANKLLIDCLNSECYMSREVRQQIEDTLLLPVNSPGMKNFSRT
ncbi:MAG: NACHT domain-containing NTPase [Nostoc sp. DedQUE04]|uniref:NACHT domain-containing NTPase n=1 Tax=Nostoc sp. DedQUE04 TaxID=3075390 RepID=UPI002AD53B93|nr:NACHT domain-containing NTPase [Nostoc sp. DedQUE04]MDZ8138222.1 NACHT domain-containing NTPase [Nostoc sp. DedQUE04]